MSHLTTCHVASDSHRRRAHTRLVHAQEHEVNGGGVKKRRKKYVSIFVCALANDERATMTASIHQNLNFAHAIAHIHCLRAPFLPRERTHDNDRKNCAHGCTAGLRFSPSIDNPDPFFFVHAHTPFIRAHIAVHRPKRLNSCGNSENICATRQPHTLSFSHFLPVRQCVYVCVVR